MKTNKTLIISVSVMAVIVIAIVAIFVISLRGNKDDNELVEQATLIDLEEDLDKILLWPEDEFTDVPVYSDDVYEELNAEGLEVNDNPEDIDPDAENWGY